MLDLQTYVLGLLGISAVGMYYIFRVIKKQINLFRITESRAIQAFRKKLFSISVIIVIMGLIPIGINIYTLFNDTTRPDKVPTLSVIYSLGVHIQPLLLSYVLWRIYRLSDDQEEAVTELERRHLASGDNR